MTGAKKFMTRIVVMFIFLVSVENSLINSALGEIAKAFPNTNPSLISLCATLASLFMFLMSFYVARVADKRNKKNLVLIGLILYLVGGVGNFFFAGNIWHILIGRAIQGVGAGISAPMCGAIIAELYEGGERAHMYGLTNGVDSIIGTFATMLGGALMLISWNYIFLTYLIFVIVIVLVILFLPSIPPKSIESIQSPTEKKKLTLTRGQWIQLIFMTAFMFLVTIGSFQILLNLAIYTTQYNVGSPLLIATTFSTFTMVTMGVSLIFGFIFKLFKRFTLLLPPVFAIVAFLVLLSTPSVVSIFAAAALCGICNGIIQPGIQNHMSSLFGEQNASRAISITMGGLFLGMFCGSFVTSFLGLFGGGSLQSVFIFGIIICAICAVLYVISVLTNKSRKDAQTA